MDVFLVPTTHWDREWYRTFQAFRARLVDTVDRVLEIMEEDPEYTFLLDGQTIVLEDYVAIRPSRRAELEGHIRSGRIEIGPWYVQPDSLIPGGEAHIRNLLEGRRVGEQFGPVTRVAYTPDSFGHPAQFPQMFAGFGLGHFVYWRGNADEIAELPAEYAWASPDGTAILACHLWQGYGNAAGLPKNVDHAVKRLQRSVEELAARTTSERVLLLAGTDHQPPDGHTRAVCEALAAATGWNVRHGILSEFVDGLSTEGRPRFEGELLGGKIANLLPSVWSTRTYMKIRNRRCESALDGWAEPWASIGRALGEPDEQPSLRLAWRELLQNQAHDSICGCSQDAVHEQMLGRYDYAEELAHETAKRMCERIAGLGTSRRVPWSEEVDIAVFNPSPHPRTDIVRFPLQGFPPFDQSERHAIHPLNWANMRTQGFTIDGAPARLVPVQTHDRVRIINEQNDYDVEFVASDVPAFGYKRFSLAPSDEHSDVDDHERTTSNGDVSVTAEDDGTLTVHFGGRELRGIGALEDIGDRGDTYDFDPVTDWTPEFLRTEVRRGTHSSGIEHLRVDRSFWVPMLDPDGRNRQASRGGWCRVVIVARLAPGVDRVDLGIEIDNQAPDHRLRMLFPTGSPVETFAHATTLDVAARSTAPRDGSGWLHVAPSTFPMQGWVSANDLTVVAPGLYEGEVTPDGVIAVTLLRAVGWLSRMDLKTRPSHAGPALPTPGAQSMRPFSTGISLFAGGGPRAARDLELGLLAVAAGSNPLSADGAPLLEIEPREVELSALKPAEDGDGAVLRLLNPTADSLEAVVRIGFPVARARAIRLDEDDADDEVTFEDGVLRLVVPPHALRSVRLQA